MYIKPAPVQLSLDTKSVSCEAKMITLKVLLICSLVVAIQCEESADKKDEPKDKPTDPPKTTTTTSTTTTEKPKMDEPPSTTPSTTTTSTTTTTVAPTPAPAPIPPAVNNQLYPPYPPFGFYPGFYPGFAPPQVVPNLGVRFNLDATTEVPQDPLKPQSPVQSYAGVFPIRQNPFPNNPFLNSLPGRGVSAYSGTFSG